MMRRRRRVEEGKKEEEVEKEKKFVESDRLILISDLELILWYLFYRDFEVGKIVIEGFIMSGYCNIR